MAGATYVLDKTYKIVNASGVGQYVAVVPTANSGECDLPANASDPSWGITQEAQATQNENVSVRVYGISRFKAKGVVAPGDPLEIATSAGDLQKADLTASGIHFIVGYSESKLADGEIGFCRLSLNQCGKTAA